MNPIQEQIRRIRVGRGYSYQNLTIFSLESRRDPALRYLTLPEALHEGATAFTIQELSGGASVPEVEVVNHLSLPVLIVEGQELAGARQHRTANVTVLVPPKSGIRLKVSCVEAGRWAQTTERFQDTARTQFASGRANKVHSISESLRQTGAAYSDQGRVWQDISGKLNELGAESPTSSMGAVFERHAPTLEGYVQAFRGIPACHGAAFALHDRVIGLDLFDRAETFMALKDRMVRGYAVEALGSFNASASRVPERGAVTRVLYDLSKGDVESYASAGIGQDVRVDGRTSFGGALVVDDGIIHLAAFPSSSRSMNLHRRPFGHL